MDRSRWRTGCAALGVAAAVVAGAVACSDPGDPLSTWVSKADDVCQQAQSDADASRPNLFQPSMSDTLQKSADLSKDEASQLRAIDLPGERRADVRDYLGTLDDRDRELDLLASETAHPSPDFQPPSLDTLTDETKQAADQAQKLGLKECAAGIDLSVAGASTTTTSPDVSAVPDGPTSEPPPNPTDLDNQTQDQAG
jgi:hypothetical protein